MKQWQGMMAAACAVLGCAAVAGCGGTGGSGTTGSGAAGANSSAAASHISVAAQPLRRLEPGDTWNYSYNIQGKTPAKVTVAVLPDRVKAPDGKECLVLRQDVSMPDGKKSTAFAAFRQDTRNSEYMFGSSNTDVKHFNWGVPPYNRSLSILSPLGTGEHWQSKMNRQDGTQRIYEAKVLGAEFVSVGAIKTDKALHIHEAIETVDRGGKILQRNDDDIWMVASIGFPVKQVRMFGAPPHTQVAVQRMDSYKLAGKPAKVAVTGTSSHHSA